MEPEARFLPANLVTDEDQLHDSLGFSLTYTAPKSINSDQSIQSAIREVALKEFLRGNDEPNCVICHCEMTSNICTTTACQHYFHRECLEQSLQHCTKCPICRKSLTSCPQGKCPNATMRARVVNNFASHCADLTDTIIQIEYSVPDGTQASYHDNPGLPFRGTHRTAYLLNDAAGRQLLRRLKYAFLHGLTFRVGTSLTTGKQNRVTWASIHHKTALGTGYAFSLPDPGYVYNCNEELDHLHVPPADECGDSV